MIDYSYAIKIHDGRSCLLIEDKSHAGNFITNNMENVVDEICHKEQINPADHIIIYQDSQGLYDGWNYFRQDFVLLQVNSWETAVELYIRQQV